MPTQVKTSLVQFLDLCNPSAWAYLETMLICRFPPRGRYVPIAEFWEDVVPLKRQAIRKEMLLAMLDGRLLIRSKGIWVAAEVALP